VLARTACLEGSAQLPKLESDMYRLPEDDLYLIPTGEVPLVNRHRGEILAASDLPVRMTTLTSCFRREAGAAGRDTRGMIRVHQFHKVEMVAYTTPQDAREELERMREAAEDVLKALGLHYRVLVLCTGDMSFASEMTYDLEAWAPGVGRYLEVSSVSTCGEFQARRTNTRYRDEEGRAQHVHMLNGSGTALPRVVVAVLEHYQQEDGSVVVPEVLRPYLGGLEVIRAESAGKGS
jgi:seryl-tRNA synthetase